MFSFLLSTDWLPLIMNLNILLGLIIIALLNSVANSSVTINRYDDNQTCNLDPKLVKEIASYKNVTKNIMKQIEDVYGSEMYSLYTDFIDNFGARLSGSVRLEKAIDYMINLTVQHGTKDVTTEEVDVPHWVRGTESCSMIKPYKKEIAILGFGSTVGTPTEGITAQVIVIKSFEELDKADEKDIKGKIVVFDHHFVNYGETVEYRTRGASKAARKGAVATLVRSVTPFSMYTLHTGSQEYDQNVTRIPTAAITLEDADLFRRFHDQHNEENAEKQPVVLHLKMESTFDMKKSRNSIIDLKGKEKPEKLVIVSGHIDSWDVGSGAMDDGGGMMISWFVPVILNKLHLKPKRTVRAILWTAEEPGLIGAQAYLRQHINELDNINFIMESDEGTFKPTGLDVAGTFETRCIIREILKLFSPIDKMMNSGSPGSDITLFVSKGVPGASLLNKNERYFWYHHSPADTMNIQSMSDVVECAAFWAAVSYVIADLSVDLPRA